MEGTQTLEKLYGKSDHGFIKALYNYYKTGPEEKIRLKCQMLLEHITYLPPKTFVSYLNREQYAFVNDILFWNHRGTK